MMINDRLYIQGGLLELLMLSPLILHSLFAFIVVITIEHIMYLAGKEKPKRFWSVYWICWLCGMLVYILLYLFKDEDYIFSGGVIFIFLYFLFMFLGTYFSIKKQIK